MTSKMMGGADSGTMLSLYIFLIRLFGIVVFLGGVFEAAPFILLSLYFHNGYVDGFQLRLECSAIGLVIAMLFFGHAAVLAVQKRAFDTIRNIANNN